MLPISLKQLSLSLGLLLWLQSAVTAQVGGNSSTALLAKLAYSAPQDVAFSSDGKLLAAGSSWGSKSGIRVWEFETQRVVATISERQGDGIERIAFSDNGKLFAAADARGDVMLWNVGSWNSHRTLISNRIPANSTAFNPDNAVSLAFSRDNTKLLLASDQEVVFFDIETGSSKTIATRPSERDSILSASFSTNDKSLIFCTYKSVQVWDIASGKQVRTWEGPGFGFFGEVSSNGEYLVAGGGSIYGEKIVDVWNTSDGSKVHELSGFRSGLFALAISRSGDFIALGGGNYGGVGDVSLWEFGKAKELGYFSTGESPIERLAFSPDDRTLAVASNDGYVLLYAVDKIRGPQLEKQDFGLCGEITTEGDKTYISPLSKVPNPMRVGCN